MAILRILTFVVLMLCTFNTIRGQSHHEGQASSTASQTAPKRVYFTFGNHMHWVDMTWNWGEEVLPSSATDMMRLVDMTGARGSLNFDAVGYEKMAERSPAVLARLREYVRSGRIEVVGASYGQPYGQFIGGESNVRQRVFGARTVERLFGRRPVTWWEEEFDFFPQLPQILKLTGFRNACLFFQWTWHTPFVPFEKDEAILWEGIDGSKLLAVPRTPLQIHQWPERWADVLERREIKALDRPLIVQWLELLPSRDWMCRSELMVPQFREFSKRADLKVQPITLSEYLGLFKLESLRTVRYGPDDVFHGMSLGKNGDLVRRMNRHVEGTILSAETVALVASTLGRPYAQWDVYPSWDLEEAWRNLMIGEGHDVDECEALCGTVGKTYMRQAEALAGPVLANNLLHLARHIAMPTPHAARERLILVFNPLGHKRSDLVTVPIPPGRPSLIIDSKGEVQPSQIVEKEEGSSQIVFVARDVPSVGYQTYALRAAPARDIGGSQAALTADEKHIILTDGLVSAVIDRRQGTILSLRLRGDPEDFVDPSKPLLELTAHVEGKMRKSTAGIVIVEPKEIGPVIASAIIKGSLVPGIRFETEVRVIAGLGRLEVRPKLFLDRRLDPTLADSLQHRVAPRLASPLLHADYPFGVESIHPHGKFQKKFPTGDWMTSPQFFEEVIAPFTGLNLVDLEDERRGLLLVHDGNEGFFRDPDGYRQVLSMYDAWDESYWERVQSMAFAFVPHPRYEHHERLNAALDFNRPLLAAIADEEGARPQLPPRRSFLDVDAPNAILSAFYRETEGTPTIRLYEVDGRPASARLKSVGEIASASMVDLLGDRISSLTPRGDSVEVKLRPHAIVTVKLDLTPARKQWRNLDSYRGVWVESGKKEETKDSPE
ncbi:MAG TPA: glycosyl hydrolase-related protein [Terriglobia bacterium]|nr:glycosyl hydrolase-related protein [Terriglobia bacterium]